MNGKSELSTWFLPPPYHRGSWRPTMAHNVGWTQGLSDTSSGPGPHRIEKSGLYTDSETWIMNLLLTEQRAKTADCFPVELHDGIAAFSAHFHSGVRPLCLQRGGGLSAHGSYSCSTFGTRLPSSRRVGGRPSVALFEEHLVLGCRICEACFDGVHRFE